jgi:phosphatidylserine/phosphatidylglycerophosphate/cardiolipin synthase-like enzyme/uncharacterized membrane protein YdjX (TVP38/TMEM64 family)
VTVTTAGTERIVEPGRNCWRVERASRFSVIQDAADYFRLVRQALLRARKTVFSLGWDITAHTDLLPGATATDGPTRLDKVLAHIARRRPELRCYVLTWDYGALHTLERDPLSRWRLGWRMPRGIRFRFDDYHPVGGCHHQKVVVIDDHLAFCGGIDLTGHRWDTSAHRVDEPDRKTPLGAAYEPYHEVQAMVMGPAAAALGQLARDRWRPLGVKRLPPLGGSTDDLWPADVMADLTDVDVAIARTVPGSDIQPTIRECEALFLDSIAKARQTIVIENQYFTNDALGAALGARLREPDGPEVIVVTPRECHGWLEQTTLGAFRDSVFRQLIAADLHRRLRIVYPLASRSRGVPTFVHSKVMFVDDAFVRVGSANCSRRSMGMDTECDLAIDARGDADVRAGVGRIRDRLLGEHLGLSPANVAREIARRGSIRALLDAHEDAERTLVRIQLPAEPIALSEVMRAAADPEEPLAVGDGVESLIPRVDAYSAGSPLRIWILPGVVLAAAGAVAWRSSASIAPPVQTLQRALDSTPAASAVWIGMAGFVLGSFVLIPIELLSVASGVAFGGLRGGLVAGAGSLVAAVAGYAAGRAIGPHGLARWMSRRSYRAGRQLGARGIGGVVVLRLAGAASAGAMHLLCGAGRVPFTRYMAGTVIGLAPPIAALTGLGAMLRRTVIQPTFANALATIGTAGLLLAAAAGLRTFLLIRQFAPSLTRHRGRAEFG